METQDAIQALKKIVLHYNTEGDFLLGEEFFEELYSTGKGELPKDIIFENPNSLNTNRVVEGTVEEVVKKNENFKSYRGGYRTRRNRHSKTKKKINSPNSLKYTKKNIFSKLNKTLKKIKKKYSL